MTQYSRFSKVLFFSFALLLAALPVHAQLMSVSQKKIKKASDAGTEQLRRQEIEEPEKSGAMRGKGVSETITTKQRQPGVVIGVPGEAISKPAPGLIFENIRVTKSDPSKQNGNGMSKVPFRVMWAANVPRDIEVKRLLLDLDLLNTDGSVTHRSEVLPQASQPNATIIAPMRHGVFAKKWTVKMTVEYVYMGKGPAQRHSKMFTEMGTFSDAPMR
jgi:hypothetical protein